MGHTIKTAVQKLFLRMLVVYFKKDNVILVKEHVKKFFFPGASCLGPVQIFNRYLLNERMNKFLFNGNIIKSPV